MSNRIWAIVAFAVVMAAIMLQGYNNSKNLRDSQIHGCERGKLDRASNARGWREAEAARRNDGDISVANTYRDIALGLEERSRINCAVAFPPPSFNPLK